MTDLARIGFAVETSGIVKGERALDSLASKGEKTERRLGKSVKTVNNNFMTLKNTIGLAGAALAALGSATAARDVIKYSDSWKNLNSQLRQVTESEEELISVRERLLNVSRETRTDLTGTVELYAVLDRSTTKLGYSTQQQIDITRTMNNMLLAGGKTAAETSGALRQLSQALESGVLRGDEFNSVAEGAPRILDALAASTGMARGALREFAATGGITAEILAKALTEYSDEAQKAADMTALTFGQSMKVASANATEFVGQSELLNNSVGALGATILSASENLDSIADATAAALSVGGAYAALVGGKYVAGLVAAEVAIVAKAKGLAASTAATTADAAAEINHLRVQQSAYASSILRIKSESTRDTIRTQLTATTAALTAAESRLVVAQNAEAAAASKATAANLALNRTRAAGSALASIALGPWGLLAAAVGVGAIAFMNAKDESDKLNESLEKQADELSRLEKIYAAMSSGALGAAYVEAQQNAIRVDGERAEVLSKLEELESKQREQALRSGDARARATDTYGASIEKLRSELSKLDAESATSEKQLKAINDAFENGLPKLNSYTDATGKAAGASKQQAAENNKLAQSYADMVKNLENERMALVLTSDEFERYMIMQQASANQWTPAMTEQILNQTKALQDQRKAIETTNAQLDNFMVGDLFSFNAEDSKNDLDDLIDKVDSFGGAWESTGNIIVDTFGGMADAMQDYIKRTDELNKIQVSIGKERKKEGADNIKLDQLQMKVNEQLMFAEIDNYKSMAGAAASMFSEKTAAAKTFSAINQTLAAAEMVLSLQKIAFGTAETAAHVANEGTKQGANALTAITSAFAAPFPLNFAMGAAMIGIMASLLGGSFGGGSGGSYEMPEEGGTGTVLGDSSAQSSSITNSLDQYEDIQIDQLAELQGIRTSMNRLSDGISALASSFAQNLDFGDEGYSGQLGTVSSSANSSLNKILTPLVSVSGIGDPIMSAIIGSFSSTKKKLVDSGIKFVTQSMEDIFNGASLNASMYQVIETTKKKFWGLSKKTSTSTETSTLGGDINEQMADIFTFIGESVIASAESLGLEAKHIITDTVDTLGLEEALRGFVIDIGDVSFLDKAGEEIQKELEAIFSQQGDLMAEYLVPSIREYQQVGEGAFETLQRVAYEQAIFNDSLERTGMSLENLSKLMQIDVAQSIIGIIGSVEKFSELSNNFFSSFYSDSEQFAYLENSLSEVFDTLGVSMTMTRSEFKAMVTGIDLTTESGKKLYASLLEIAPSMDEYLTQLDDLADDKLSLQIQLLEEMGKSEEALALERKRELEGLDDSLKALMLQIYAQQDLNKAREAERELLTNNVNFAKSQLEKARIAEVDRINATVKASENAYSSTIESINLQREAYYRLIDDLESAVASSKTMLEASRDAELSRYDALIAAAKDTSITEIDLINSVSSARLEALNNELSIVSSVANKFGASSVGVSAIDALTAARAGNFEPATRVQTGGEYSSALEARIGQGRESFALAEIGKLADSRMSDIERSILATESSADRQILAIEYASNKEVEALQSQRDAVEAQIKEVLGIDDNILSLDAAIHEYQKAQDELANAKADGTLLALQAQEDLALETLEQIRTSAESQIDALNEQVDLLLGIDNSVLSVEEAIKLLLEEEKALSDFEASIAQEQLWKQGETNAILDEINVKMSEAFNDSKYYIEPQNQAASNEDVVNELKALRKDLDNANAQIGENTAKTANSVRKLEYMQSNIK